VTLAFLGWRAEAELPAIEGAIQGARAPVSLLRTDGVVLLPPRRPRVMAVRLDDPARATIALQESVSAALVGAGVYEPSYRAWLPHVTIGRARGPLRRDAPVPDVPALEFLPPSMTLFRSHLQRGGAQYEPLARFNLTGPHAN